MKEDLQVETEMRVREAPHGVEAGVIVDLRVRAGPEVRANLKEKRGAKAKRRNVQDLGIDQIKENHVQDLVDENLTAGETNTPLQVDQDVMTTIGLQDQVDMDQIITAVVIGGH